MPDWDVLDDMVRGILASFLGMLTAPLHQLLIMVEQFALRVPDVTGQRDVRYCADQALLTVQIGYVVMAMAAVLVAMGFGGLSSTYSAKDVLQRMVLGFVAAHESTWIVKSLTDLTNTMIRTQVWNGLYTLEWIDQGTAMADRVIRDPGSILLIIVIEAVVIFLIAWLIISWLIRVAALSVMCGLGPLALACHGFPWLEAIAQAWWRDLGVLLVTAFAQAFTLNLGLLLFLNPAAGGIGVEALDSDVGLRNLLLVLCLLLLVVRMPGIVRQGLGASGAGGRGVGFLGAAVRLAVTRQILMRRPVYRGPGGGAAGAAGAARRLLNKTPGGVLACSRSCGDDWVMQGASDPQRELLDVESVVGHLLPAGSVFAFLAQHRGRLFPADMFEDLFPSGRGRPSIAPEIVASVIVLQTLNGLSDRAAAEAVTFDLRWKAALGLAVTSEAFHPTTLTVWRRRLAGSARPERIFDAVRDVIVQTGAVKGKTRRAMDSTILDDAVARQDTVTQLIAAIRRVGRLVPGADALVLGCCTGYDYTRTGKPDIAWDDQQAREDLVSALVTDALALLGALQEADQCGWGEPQLQAVALLGLVAGQDVEPAEGSDGTDGRWRIARRTAEDRVISTVDPETRHAHKSRHRRQDGFKAHIVIEPDTGLITETELTKAAGADNSDGAVGTRLVKTDPTIDLSPPEQAEQGRGGGLEVLGDSAYGSGEALSGLQQAGYTPIIKPGPLRAAVEGGFTVDDFTVDEGAQTVTCPNQVTRPISRTRKVTFAKACIGCPFRSQCTTSATGRSLTLRPHDALQRAQRVRAKDPAFQAVYRRHRPMVERSIAWLTRGNRRVPYRGVTKNNAWIHHRVAAINLRRLLVLGLTRHDGIWILTPA